MAGVFCQEGWGSLSSEGWLPVRCGVGMEDQLTVRTGGGALIGLEGEVFYNLGMSCFV